MPDPIPVMMIGRLAIDSNYQGRGLGRALLRDAVLRTLQAADIAGIRAVLVHAISEDAKRFYERCGFQPSPLDPMTLMITLRDARRGLIGDNDTRSRAVRHREGIPSREPNFESNYIRLKILQ